MIVAMWRNTVSDGGSAPPPDDPPLLADVDGLPREQSRIARVFGLRDFGLALRFSGWQLQDSCRLAGHEARYQHDLPAGEFQRVMVDVGIVHIDLTESGHAMGDARPAEHAESAVELNVAVESELRTGKQADGHVGFTDFGKAARDRFDEIGGNEPVRDLSRPRGDEMQTVVAHGKHSSQGPPLRLFLLNPPLDQMFREVGVGRRLFALS
jgi:hypothetical protein